MIYLKADLKDLLKYTETAKNIGAGIEVSVYDIEYIDSLTLPEFMKIAEGVFKSGIELYSHLPMYALNLGAKDPNISKYSREIIIRGLEISAGLKVKKAVMHNGLNPLEPLKSRNIWLKRFLEEFDIIYKTAKEYGIELLMENVWDNDGWFFEKIGKTYPELNYCFDIGHAEVYMKGIEKEEFIKKFSEKIKHLHVHDNKGSEDDHYHIGEGDINLEEYFGYINKYCRDYTATLETKIDEYIENDVKKLKELKKIKL